MTYSIESKNSLGETQINIHDIAEMEIEDVDTVDDEYIRELIIKDADDNRIRITLWSKYLEILEK